LNYGYAEIEGNIMNNQIFMQGYENPVWVSMLGANTCSFSDGYSNGVIGLGPVPIDGFSLLITELSNADIIDAQTFGMAFFSNEKPPPNSIYFGGVNPTYASGTGALSWVPLVAGTLFWEIGLSSINV
jgi:hypothetical protein